MQPSHTSIQIQGHILKRFNIIKKVGSGAYGHVWKVQDRLTKKIYALKKIFDAFQHATDAQRTYRQIQILKQVDHPNIIKLYQTIKADNNNDVYLVFEFMQADLHGVIAQGLLKDPHIRYIIYQLAKALKYLHSGFMIHRDLKPSNILINSSCLIKLCDFGLVRSIHSTDSTGPVLTEGVATRWYRAPEILLGSKSYSTPADVWSFACIIYQIIAQKPLFPGNSTVQQIQKILQFTGYPTQQDIKSLQSDVVRTMLKQSKIACKQSQSKSILKDFPPQFIDLIQHMLIFNPIKRITIQQLLQTNVVKPYRKIQQQTISSKQLKAPIDDNKKLTVQQYRNLIYGPDIKGLTKTQSLTNLQCKNTPQIKKSNSYARFNTITGQTQSDQKNQHQTIKHCRSSKDIIKPLHTYNKSTETAAGTNNQITTKYQTQSITTTTKDTTKDLYAGKNWIYRKIGDSRYKVSINQSSAALVASQSQTSNINSQKSIPTATKPLYKTSKLVVHKTEPDIQKASN